MRYVWLIFVLAFMVGISGCGKEALVGADLITDNDYDEMNMQNNEVMDFESDGANEAEVSERNVLVSDQLVTIPYQGDLFIRSIVNTGYLIFMSGVESSGGNYVIHKMKIGDSVSERMPIDIPADMAVQGINVDVDGNLHFFFSDTDWSTQRCEMWVSDQEGNVIRKIDMKKAFNEEGSHLIEFVIDAEGRYYISGSRLKESESGITVLDAAGNVLGLVDSPDVPLWNLSSLARGKDGAIYVAGHTNDQENIAVVSIDPEALCIAEFYEGVLPTGFGEFVRMRAGIDADLYLFGSGGVYSYNLGDESSNMIIPNLSFESLEGSLCHDFLSDGRFLYVDGERLMYSGVFGGVELPYLGEMYKDIMFYYMPVAHSAESEE